MKCPLCGREMKQIYLEGISLINPEMEEEMQDCKCSVRYEYCCGNEQFTKNGQKINL